MMKMVLVTLNELLFLFRFENSSVCEDRTIISHTDEGELNLETINSICVLNSKQ